MYVKTEIEKNEQENYNFMVEGSTSVDSDFI